MAQDKPQSTRDEILAGLGGALDACEPFSNEVLLGVYMKGNYKTLPNGQKLYYTDKQAGEDQWQGKVGVVLKKGRKVFKDDAGVQFDGDDVAVGDWIVFRVSDGFSLDINGVHCRMIQDIHVRMRVAAPSIDAIY